MVQIWKNLSDDKRQQYTHGAVKFYSPVTQNYLPASNLGAITERLDDLIRNYITTHGKLDKTNMDKRTFEKMMHFKSLKSCIDPGESVGILASQSIGEASTQMTLNSELILIVKFGIYIRLNIFKNYFFQSERMNWYFYITGSKIQGYQKSFFTRDDFYSW